MRKKMKRFGLVAGVSAIGFLLATFSVALSAAAILAPGWMQVNTDGFGNPNNFHIAALEPFNGYLYAGTWSNNVDEPGQIWRSADGKSWNQVTPPWAIQNSTIFDMQVFGTHLYAGTGNENGGEVWRSVNGLVWEQVANAGFGDIENGGVNSFAVFSNMIILATTNTASGLEVWVSPSGNSGTWTRVVDDAFGEGSSPQDLVMSTYDGFVYLGFGFPAKLWRSDDGIDWSPVFTDGLGNANNSQVASMAEFDGYFYIGLRNTVTGGEVWRSVDAEKWTLVFANGNGDPANARPYGLTQFNDRLYLTMSNLSTGAEVWESSDGLSWTVIADNGWGDPMNQFADYFDKGNSIFNSGLYLGTLNETNGGEVWLYLPNHLFLPVIIR